MNLADCRGGFSGDPSRCRHRYWRGKGVPSCHRGRHCSHRSTSQVSLSLLNSALKRQLGTPLLLTPCMLWRDARFAAIHFIVQSTPTRQAAKFVRFGIYCSSSILLLRRVLIPVTAAAHTIRIFSLFLQILLDTDHLHAARHHISRKALCLTMAAEGLL